ncbi:MAG TPA: hypothetical protein VNH64_01855 [Parvularculaceae bacterium]|nr:hypothetical protein [Parvularculaceae bacterium]
MTAKQEAVIEVKQIGQSDPLAFKVAVREGVGETHHNVTMSRADYERLANGAFPPARCVEAAFRFLLDREPKEAILSRFDVSAISRYFPEFEAELPRYIAGG